MHVHLPQVISMWHGRSRCPCSWSPAHLARPALELGQGRVGGRHDRVADEAGLNTCRQVAGQMLRCVMKQTRCSTALTSVPGRRVTSSACAGGAYVRVFIQ
jgi:hypothetical protein